MKSTRVHPDERFQHADFRQCSRRILAVMHRCRSRVALVGALWALGIGLQPPATQAASVNPNASPATADYRLTSSTSLPVPDATAQGPLVVALILPAGSVVPPKLSDGSQGSPLTVLPDSHGFDADHLVVALKDGTSASGQAEQMFGLVFFGQGLQPGGLLHFALSIDGALANHPPELQSLTPGISIVADLPPGTLPPTSLGGNGGSGSGGGIGPPLGNEIPEPISVALWSVTLLGLVARKRLGREIRGS
jgi:hypothetical protein